MSLWLSVKQIKALHVSHWFQCHIKTWKNVLFKNVQHKHKVLQKPENRINPHYNYYNISLSSLTVFNECLKTDNDI